MGELVDGMTFEQVKYNVYVFGADAKRFRQKVERARKPHTRERWQRRLDEALFYLENNKRRLAKFSEEV